MTSPQESIDLSELNQSELVELCRWMSLEASRAWPRELLIQCLQMFDCIEVSTIIEKKAAKLSEWLNLYWDRMQMQAQKKVCPNCHLCRDAQVLACYQLNRRKLEGV